MIATLSQVYSTSAYTGSSLFSRRTRMVKKYEHG